MRFSTPDNRSVVWKDGEIGGDADLIVAVQTVISEGGEVMFNFWGERPASLATEFDAYITIGSVLVSMYAVPPIVDEIPDNPDGYMPEGPIPDDLALTAALRVVTAAAYKRNRAITAAASLICMHGSLTAACHSASCRPPTSGGTGGSEPGWLTAHNAQDAATIKYEGALKVASNMTHIQKENIHDVLDYVATNQPGDDIFMELNEEAASIGSPIGMTVGVAAQLSAISDWSQIPGTDRKVPKLHDAIDRHNAAVEGGADQGESLAKLSREFERITGITIEAGFVAHVNSAWAQSSTSMTSMMMQLTAARAHELPEALDSLRRHSDGMLRQVISTADKVTKALHAVQDATYRTTQEELERHGVTEVSLYRGVKRRDNGQVLDTIIAQPNPLSSWTTSDDVAQRFASHGYVYRATLPAANVYSIASVTGGGSLEEREMIVIGRPIRAEKHVTAHEFSNEDTTPVVYIDAEDPDWIKHLDTEDTQD